MSNNYYNNIVGLLKPNICHEYTKDNLKELYRCKQDIIYFLQKYVKIIDQQVGEVFFNPYEHQIKAINEINKHRRNILCWTRQGFKTTTAAGIMLHYALFNKNKGVAILANKGDTSKEILERIQFAYVRLPEWMQVGVTSWQKTSITLGNGSKIISANTSPDSIRGKSISFLYVDEAAFVDDWEIFWKATYPVVSSNPKAYVLLTSTPNGLNHFYKLTKDSKNNRLNFKVNEVKWDQIPGRDELWAENALKDLGGNEDDFEQEYNLGWLGNSNSLISMQKLRCLSHDNPIELEYDNKFKIYEKPYKNSKYFLLCDYGEGIGQDSTTIHVFKRLKSNKFKQVAVYKNNLIKPRPFATIKSMIGKMYNDALIIGESNSIGQESLNELFEELEYENVYFHEIRIPGIKQTKKTKKLGNSYLKSNIENDKFEIVDFDTINELSTYVKRGKSYEADKKCHDDLVTPLVIFSFLLNDEDFIINYLDDYDMRDSDEQFDNDVLEVYMNNDEYDEDGWTEVQRH